MHPSLISQFGTRIGQDLHLLLFYSIGFWLAVKNRRHYPETSGPFLIAFSLFLVSLAVSTLRLAWNDVFPFIEASNGKDIQKTILYLLAGAVSFITTLAAWISLLFGINKAINTASINPSA